MPIQANQPAPEFNLADEKGNIRSLAEFRGQAVVLYFYPKDDTPGCTVEACNFRDDYSAYQENGVVILGISPDTVKSHTKFKDKFNLPFPLLADPDHKTADAYGVWGPKKFMGKAYEGILRTTFLIGPNGDIVKVFENVKPAGHSAQVLGALKESA
ncbi:MAG: thioredoxin-dependent thiol peroxidase [Anaerolineaceae bacterium]|nr:thioredoxin-dependent thiol peroxidase [Anaerolineaceae bacterium]